MIIVDHQLADYLIRERRAHADRARLLAVSRRRTEEMAWRDTPASATNAEVVELVFGCHCEGEQIGA